MRLSHAQAPVPAPSDGTAGGAVDRAGEGGRTLRECYRTAVVANESVARAGEAVVQARALRDELRSGLLPRLGVEDTYYRQDLVQLQDPGGGSAFSFEDERNELLLRLQQPLFHGLGDIAALRSASAGIAASEASLLTARRDLYTRVAIAFYLVLGREAQVRAFGDSVALQQERLREIQARNEVGLTRRTEVLLADTELATAEAGLTAARNQAAIAREELAFLMVEPVRGPLQDDLEVPELPTVEAVAQAALEARRDDLVAAERRIEAARHQVGVARAGLLPGLDLEGTWILDRNGYSTFATETDWTAQLELRVPLFDGLRSVAAMRRARSETRVAELERDEIVRRIRLEAERARLALGSSLAQRQQLEKAVVSAEASYELAAEEYRSGLATNLEVIAAQNRRLENRLDLERQRYQVKVDWLALEIALGRRPAPEDEP